jgi:cytoskeleton protein RodZ
MVDGATDTGAEPAGLFPQSVGERLHAARVATGLDLGDIATKTRVPMRHLEAIERSDYASLPSVTYALGFARSYAKAVGLDEVATTRDLRAELGRAPIGQAEAASYEPVDPTRVPSRLLAWTAAGIAVVLLIGYFVWKSMAFGEAGAPQVATDAPPAIVAAPANPASTPAAAPSSTGQVVLTATAAAWVRIYDRNDKVLFEKEMAVGESWPVPGDADTPMIRTGRADALKVTIDGREVAPLGPPERTIRDVGLSAAALAARPPAAVTPVPSAPSPANTSAPSLL